MNLNGSVVGPTLLGVAGVLGAITAAVTGIRGLRQTGRTQTAATVLADRVQALAELEAVVTRLQQENARLGDLNDRDRVRHERELNEKLAELGEQTAKCARQIALVTEAMDTLRSVVTDEIARAAATLAVDTATRHVANHPPTHPEGTSS